MAHTGTFFAVCGPSGAGKDTVLRRLRDELGTQDELHFARRIITREAGEGEENEFISSQEFARLRRNGGFMLQWQAHGLDYGLPVSLLDTLKSGRSVIANLSRGALPEVRRIGVPVVVIEITASPEVLAQRLDTRGREDAMGRRERLERNALYEAGIEADHRVLNDGLPEVAASQVAALILDVLEHAAA